MCVSATVRVGASRPHIFSSWNIKLHTGTGCYYIWLMSFRLDEIEMFLFMTQASTTVKSPHKTPLPPYINRQSGWADKIFSIKWWKLSQKSLYSLVFLMPDVSVISYDEKDLLLLWQNQNYGLWKIKPSIICLWLPPCSSLLSFSRIVFISLSLIWTCHCWIVTPELSIFMESVI